MLWHKIQGAGGVGNGGSITELSYINNYTASSFSTLNFGTVSLGEPDPNRFIVIAAAFYSNTNNSTFSSINIGTSPLFVRPVSSGPLDGTGLYVFSIPTGTTASVTASFSGFASRNGCLGIYRLIHEDGLPFATAIGAGSVSLSTATSGVALFLTNGINISPGTPTNYAEDYDVDYRSNERTTAGQPTVSLGGTITMSSSTASVAAAASWD